jgi:TonB family protein
MIHAMKISPIRSDWTGRDVDGRFPLLEWLGGSEWSGVFLTELQGHGSQKAVLKLIAANTRDANTQMDCWASTKNLSHPNLMPLFCAGRCQIDNASLLYVVTAYAEEVLSDILAERPLTPAETEEMLPPVVDALAYLHKNGMVHGRLKPANILAVEDQLKISSDQLHVANERGSGFPAPTVLDAPEVASGTISPAADVWSIGITLVQALTQAPPRWEGSAQPDPTVPESIPQPFADIARGCLRSDPARRFTLSDVKARLGLAQIHPGSAAKAGKTAPAKLGVAAFVVGVLAVAGVIAALQLRFHSTQPQPQFAVPSNLQETVPPRPAGERPSQAKPNAAGPALSETASPPSPAPETHTSEPVAVDGEVVERVLPEVLPAAMKSIQGKVDVTVRATVDPQGEVSDATLDSPGSSRYFARVALEAAKKWKLKPAQANGEPVPSVWILRFEFKQTGIAVTPFKTSP